MPQILVTGGTGALGRVVARRLVDAGQSVRVMTRRPRPDGGVCDWAVADLATGEGVDAAVAGSEVIIHLATANAAKKDRRAAMHLVEAARRAGTAHLVYMSIVGIDRVPMPYYRGKLAVEELIEGSGVPHTILRSTQFHDLIRVIFAGAAKAPVMLVPGFQFQPVDVREVATRIAELAVGDPMSRAADLGGPQVRDASELARAYLAATGRRRPLVSVRLPGRIFRAYRSGDHLAPAHADGTITFEEYLADHPSPGAMAYRGSP